MQASLSSKTFPQDSISIYSENLPVSAKPDAGCFVLPMCYGRDLDNVTAQSVILAIAHNINKYHNKIQSGKTGQHLFEVKKSA